MTAETLLPGDFTRNDRAPILCRDPASWLNAEDDAHPVAAEDAKRKQQLRMPSVVRPTAIASLPAERQHPALCDDLAEAVNKQRVALFGKMLMSGNAVIVTAAWRPSWPGTEMEQWRAVAVSRNDRSLLWEVELPVQPALGGMSLTRGGDVLVPLVNGRIVCIGGDAVEHPVPAVAVADVQPGLLVRGYASDAVASGYRFWTPADFAIMEPMQTWVLPEPRIKDDKADKQTVLRLSGYLDVPETGRYSFLGKSATVQRLRSRSMTQAANSRNARST